MNNESNDFLQFQNSAQRNITRNSLIAEKYDQLDSSAFGSILIHKKNKDLQDFELQDIPLRKGESVDLEQINENSQVQSLKNIMDLNNIVNLDINNDITNNNQNKENVIKTKTSTFTSGYKKSDVMDEKKIEQLQRIKNRMPSIATGAHANYNQNGYKLSFKLLINVRGFYRNVSNNSRIFQKLTEFQHQLIGDKSTIYLKQYSLSQFPRLLKIINALQSIQMNLSLLLQKIPIFNPYNIFKLIWDCILAFLILTVIFLLSLIIFFNMDDENVKTFFQICFMVFIFNIFVHFNTGVMVKGKLIQDRAYIMKLYLYQYFVLDFLGLVPIYLQFTEVDMNSNYIYLLNFMFLTKIYEFLKIIERISSLLNYQKNMKNVIDLVRLVFIIGCVCHIFCVFWHGLAMLEIKQGRKDTWIHAKNLSQEQSILIKYIYSFYYLAVTMITVGYGDITPQNPIEMTFTILTMFVTGFFYAYSLNRIGKIISNTESQDKAYKDSMQVIHAYMREENVNSELRVKESKQVQKNQERLIINQLSQQLKKDLEKNVKGKYLKDIPFISQMISQDKLITLMKEFLFSPGEYIFHQNDLDDCSIFYLVKGEVEILIENDINPSQPQIIKTLQKQNYFGEISFITGNKRSASVRAIDFCRVYKLERREFLEQIKKNACDFETFCMMKEAIQLKSNYKLSKINCYSCLGNTHLMSECPKIHFTVSRHVLAIRTFQSSPQVLRNSFKRRTKRYHSFQIIDICLEAAYQILNDDVFSQNWDSSQFIEECVDIPSNLDELVVEFQAESQNQIQHIRQTSQKASIFNPKKPQNMQNISEDGKQDKLDAEVLQGRNQDVSLLENLQEESSQIKSNKGTQDGQSNSEQQRKNSNASSIQTEIKTQDKQTTQPKNISEKLNNSKKIGHEYIPRQSFKELNDVTDKTFSEQSIQKKEDNNKSIEFCRISSEQDSKIHKICITPLKGSNNILPASLSIQSPLIYYKKKSENKIQKQVSFKNNNCDDLHKNRNPNNKCQSEIFIQSLENIQYVSAQQIQSNKNNDAKYEMSMSQFHEESIYNSQNQKKQSKLQVQSYFQQIKSRTINQQIQKAQKIQNNSNLNINVKSIQMDSGKFAMELQNKMSLPDSKVKNQVIEEHLKNQFLDERFKNKYVEDYLKKGIISINYFPSETAIDNQQIPFLRQSHEKRATLHQVAALNDNYQILEWEYYSLKYFESAKQFSYYHPLQNYNNIIQNLKRNNLKKNNIKSRKTMRVCMQNRNRRSPVFSKKYPQSIDNTPLDLNSNKQSQYLDNN